MVVLACNPKWRAVSWLVAQSTDRGAAFREDWLSQSGVATESRVTDPSIATAREVSDVATRPRAEAN
jgi:hypothetical protein